MFKFKGMRPSALLILAVVASSCSKGGDDSRPGSASDSSEVVTELNPATDSSAKGAARTQASAPLDVASQQSAAVDSSANSSRATSTAGKASHTDLSCGIRNGPVLTSLGIGNLQIGRTVAVVKQTCRVVRDEAEMTEGNLERVLTVMIGDDPIRATVVNGLIWRVVLRSPHFETRDGLRVGTTLSRLTARGGVHLLEGEDGLYVTLASHCGLSFRFTIPSRETPGKAWTVAHVVQRHGSAVADRILVTRCPG